MHDDITELKRDIGLDCGDHSCRYAVVRTGMRTNGGCRCEPPAKQIADLTAKLNLLSQYVHTEDGVFGFPDGDIIDVNTGPLHEDLTRRLEEAQRSYDALSATRDAIYAKLAAVERERDALRTALLALPVAQEALQSIMQAWQHKSHDQEVGSFHFWFSANIEQFDAALLRLAQAMRGGK